MGRKAQILQKVLSSSINFKLFELFHSNQPSIELRKRISDKYENVIVAFANQSFHEFFKNWFNALKKVGIEHQIILFTNDIDEKEYQKYGITVINWESGIFGNTIPKKAVEFSSDLWQEITITKLDIVYQLLSLGKNVLFSDLDIIFLKNPFDYFREREEDIDIFIQSDSYADNPNPGLDTICSGFYYAKSNRKTIKLFCIRMLYSFLKSFPNDQVLLQSLLMKSKSVNAEILDKRLFPNGDTWYKKSQELSTSAYIVHYNWIITQKEKIAKMKQYNHWLI